MSVANYLTHSLGFLVAFLGSVHLTGAIFMWTAPPPAWNQTVLGTGGARTVVIQVRNGTTDYPLRWNYTLLAGQTIIFTTFAVGDGISQPTDIGFVVNPGGVGESTTINNVNDFHTRFRLQNDRESSTLTIINVNERESATFQCKVQVGSNVYAYNVRIVVTVPPSITHISGTLTVTEEQNVTLNCTASGNPAPNITWTRLSDSTVVKMPLKNIKRQEEGGYRCTADNGVGSPITRDTFIVVSYKPDNVTLVANTTENKDCSDVFLINFTCVAFEANPPVQSYRLFGNGELPIPDISRTWIQEISEKGKHVYSCWAEHPLGNVTSSNNVTVTLNVPVQISANLITGSATPISGNNVSLCCNASGFPEPNITWSKVLSNTLVAISSSKWLNFTDIKKDKTGDYICQANNTCGKRTSSVISIEVQHKPENVTLNASISTGKACSPKKVKFTCKAGAATPEVDKYTLHQNDEEIANLSGPGVFTLWLNASGQFVYWCEAKNSVGTGTSNNITFTVEVPALVIYVNDSIVITEDENATLFCNTSGVPSPNVSWVNATNGVSRVGDTFFLAYLTEDNQGEVYTCIASNACGNDSKSTVIEVQFKPKRVTLNVSKVKICTGNMVNFTCRAASANPEVHNYTLYQNGTEIANMSGSGVFTLWLNTSGQFFYSCMANNSVGLGTSKTVIVTVEVGASVTSVNGSIVVEEGDNVTLFCNVTGVRDPNVSWSYGKNVVLGSGRTLALPNISRDFNGSVVSCSASNTCVNDSKPTFVLVQYKPENVMLNKSNLGDEVCAGSMVKFTCKAGAANPEVDNYTLYQNGTEIANMSGSGIFTLWLNTSGQFIHWCKANNSVGTGTSNNVSVTIKGPLSLSSVSPRTVVKEGDNVTLICSVTGDPNPNVFWVDSKNEVTNNGATWTLPKINRALNGTYSCVASNACGKYSKTTAIDVQYTSVVTWRITLTITNKDCNNFPEEEFRREVEKSLDRLGLNSIEIKTRCGSVVVDLSLGFNQRVGVNDVISALKDAANDGKLGDFNVDSNSIKPTSSISTSSQSPTNAGECNCSCNIVLIVIIGILAAIIIVLIIIIIWQHKKGTATRPYEVPPGDAGFYDNEIAMKDLTPAHVPPSSSTQRLSMLGSAYMDLQEATRSEKCRTDQSRPTIRQDLIPPQPVEYAPLNPKTRSWEVARDKVTVDKIIGKGAFGQVAKATAIELPFRTGKTTVAVKMLKPNAPETDKKDLLSELELMKTLKPHPHIIKLMGCVTLSEPLLVLIEYVPYGDLLGYLRKSRGLNDTYYKDPDIKPQTSLTSQQLMKFAWQIADGMRYLSSRKIIHRDLAARNVLVGEGETCKVTDFGMARDVQQEDIYEKKTRGRLPVKWTAYESLLYGTYTTRSDIWSYGVVLYEIFTIGGSPYPRMDGRKIANVLQHGYRMPKPQHVDDSLYQIMMNCWQNDPEARPSFTALTKQLKEMEKQHKRLINMHIYDNELYAKVEDLNV